MDIFTAVILWYNKKYIHLVSSPFLTQSSPNSYKLPSDRDARSILCSKIWSLTLVPDTKLLKPLEFLGDGNIFCSMRWFWVDSWMASGGWLVSRETKPCLETLLPNPNLWGGERTSNWVNDQSCLHDEAFIKIHKLWSSESFRLVNTSTQHTPTLWWQKLLHSGPFLASPYVSLHLVVHLYHHILYYIINQ